MKKILNPLFILAIAVACSAPSSTTLVEHNFPLKLNYTLVINAPIEEVAILNTWISVVAADKISGYDINTQRLLWSVDFSVITYAHPGIRVVDDVLLAASADELIAVDRSGVIKKVELNPKGGTITRLAAVYSNYVYIIRGPKWILEAYDFLNNKLLWTTTVGRGARDAFYDESRDTVYVPTSNNSILALDNSSGKLLWRKNGHVLQSVFEGGILYTFESMGGVNHYSFAAIDMETQEGLWRQDIVLTPTKSVEYLTTEDGFLIAGTGAGLIALDKSTGKQTWHILEDEEFRTVPVQFNDTIFVEGSNRTIYAIIPSNGSIIGTLKLGNPSSFERSYEVYAGVHKFGNGVLFNTKDTIYMYSAQ